MHLLASALPVSLAELGFVGFAVGDRGSEALLEWAMSARKFSMLCIERHNFSDDLRLRFQDMAHTRRGMLLVI